MKNNNYRLFLFKPSAINYIVDWNSFEYRENLLGELKVDNLTTSIKLQDISTINFDIPENVFGEFNPRLDDVLDNYIVELWYGDLSNPTIQRFVIIKTPMEYNNGLKKYSYQGDSIEGTLEFQQMLNWGGIQVKDFYRTIKYEYVKSGTTVTTNRFTENPATGASIPTYTIFTSTQTVAEGQEAVKYITVPTTTASSNPPSPLDIFIYQYRRDAQDTLNTESSLIEFNQNTPGGTQYQNESGFKPGFYIPVLNSLGKVTAIHIALPKDYTSFYTTINSVSSNKVLEFFLYDNPVSRHFAIGINTDEEIQASDMYLDLAQDSPVKFVIAADVVQNSNIITTTIGNRRRIIAGQTVTLREGSGIASNTKIVSTEVRGGKFNLTLSNNYTGSTSKNKIFNIESLNAAEYGAYGFTAQIVYSRNGLKLEDCLLGTQETRNVLNEIQNNKLNFDGILFETGYTIGVIHPEIASKYRSNIELNNITKYQAIKNLAESFEAIAIFDNVNKTVSFYPDKNEQAFSNNGLIITKQNYLKDITNDIDASKVITKAYASGKNNLGISLITPNGGNYWEDYSYYLDRYYVAYPSDNNLTNQQKLDAIANSGVALEENSTTGISFTSFPTGNLARWINATEALKISKWQFTRDYFHDIMLGNFTSTITAHNTRYFDLYNLRSTAINEFVKEETKYFELKATEYRYKYIYDSYVKENDNLAENTRQKTYKYLFDSSTTVEDPGTKDFRLNTNSFTTATQIIIDDLDNSNSNRRSFLSSITSTKNPRIQLKTAAKSAVYQIDSVNSTNTGYIILNVTNLFNSGTAGVFTNTELVDLIFLTWEEVYFVKYTEAKNASEVGLNKLNQMHYNIYNTKFDGSIALETETNLINIETNSFATKIQEVQKFLSKDVWSIDDDELKPFVKEAVMSDSALDNELDLLIATREYLLENGQPIVTIDISILDFLSSIQTSMDWNKVKIGEIINIYYPDFNIDTTAQLREIDIDFQSNKLNFTISTYRKYTRNLMTYVLKNLRKTYDSQTNNYNYQYDENKVGTERITVIDKKTKKGKKEDGGGGGFDAKETPFNFGSMSSDGSTSTDISGEGIISQVIEVDPVLETFVYLNDQRLQIADGTLKATDLVKNENDDLLYTTEVEVSGDNGFVIRKINPNGDVLPQVYIDTNGNAVFAGALSAATGTFAGELSAATGSFTGSIAIGTGNSIFKADSQGIYLGDATFAGAPFSVTQAGAIKATAGTISGLNIGIGYKSTNDRTNQIDSKNAIFKRVNPNNLSEDLPGVWGENETRFYLDQDGRFSLSDEIKWDPVENTFFVNGTIEATFGDIGGWTVAAEKLHAGSSTTYVELNADAASSYAIFAGNENPASAPFSVTKTGVLISSSGTIAGWSVNSENLSKLYDAGLNNDVKIYAGLLPSAVSVSGAGEFGFAIENTNTNQEKPFMVSMTNKGFYIFTDTDAANNNQNPNSAIEIAYNDDYIWAKGLLISDNKNVSSANVSIGTLAITNGSPTNWGMVINNIVDEEGSIITIDKDGIEIIKTEDNLNTTTFSVDVDGNVTMKGVIDAEAGGQIGGFNIGVSSLTSGTSSGNYLGISPGQGVNSNISFWAGATDNTTSGIDAAPFRVTNTGNIFANSGTFSFLDIDNEGFKFNLLTRLTFDAPSTYIFGGPIGPEGPTGPSEPFAPSILGDWTVTQVEGWGLALAQSSDAYQGVGYLQTDALRKTYYLDYTYPSNFSTTTGSVLSFYYAIFVDQDSSIDIITNNGLLETITTKTYYDLNNTVYNSYYINLSSNTTFVRIVLNNGEEPYSSGAVKIDNIVIYPTTFAVNESVVIDRSGFSTGDISIDSNRLSVGNGTDGRLIMRRVFNSAETIFEVKTTRTGSEEPGFFRISGNGNFYSNLGEVNLLRGKSIVNNGFSTSSYSATTVINPLSSMIVQNHHGFGGINQRASILLSASGNSGTNAGTVVLNAVSPVNNVASADFVVQTRNTGVYSEVMRIKSTGEFGIGTNNPSEKLDVNGNINLGGTSNIIQETVSGTTTNKKTARFELVGTELTITVS
jgi:hypothetical protein